MEMMCGLEVMQRLCRAYISVTVVLLRQMRFVTKDVEPYTVIGGVLAKDD